MKPLIAQLCPEVTGLLPGTMDDREGMRHATRAMHELG